VSTARSTCHMSPPANALVHDAVRRRSAPSQRLLCTLAAAARPPEDVMAVSSRVIANGSTHDLKEKEGVGEAWEATPGGRSGRAAAPGMKINGRGGDMAHP
jgi:hypothetical protein